MALFAFKKKDDDAGKGGGGGASPEGPHEFDDGKAQKFFERATTLHEATNFGYAMNMWIRGLRFNPTAMNGLEGFFKSSASFFGENPKGEKEDVFKSTVKDASGRTDVDKYLSSLVQWSAHPAEATYAVRAMELASNLGLGEPALWIADRAGGAVLRDKKPRKEHMVAVMKVYQKYEKFEKAVQAGEAAVRIDPSDGQLAADVKNLSAEWTTKKGGFDQTGQEGGFRQNIRDAAKQRQMEDRDRIVSTEEQMDRQVAAARADAAASPNDRPNAIRLIDALKKRGKPEDEEEAIGVAEAWYEKTKEYRFRDDIDSIRLRQLRRNVHSLRLQGDRADATDETKEALRQATGEYIKAQIRSLQGKVEAYPTDLGHKFELAKLFYQVRKYEEAIGLLQEARTDPKNRAQANFYLGLSFQKIGYNDEAIETLRQAMTTVQAGDESTEMTLKYALMEALLARAMDQASMPDAQEADKLASQIAIHSFNFKDIKAKREEIKSLITRLKGGPVPGSGTPTS